MNLFKKQNVLGKILEKICNTGQDVLGKILEKICNTGQANMNFTCTLISMT